VAKAKKHPGKKFKYLTISLQREIGNNFLNNPKFLFACRLWLHINSLLIEYGTYSKQKSISPHNHFKSGGVSQKM